VLRVRYLLALCVSFAALTLGSRGVVAQTAVRPHASVLWAAAAGPPRTEAIRSTGPVQERNALIGGLLGAALGGIAGHAMCRRFSHIPGDPCIGTALGHDADR
jgi:outer membrane lipoprotein SlyB